jgi:tripartite-type tricarboxylate transporter receptor subunit TctC
MPFNKSRWLSTLVLSLTVLNAAAQNYPERPIKVIQGFAPGGNADAIARVVSSEMMKVMGQSFVIEAQTGAGGNIAAASVARAKPDGYTLLLATGGHAVAGAVYKELNYKTVDDFEMISTVTYFPFLWVVRADSPYKTLAEALNDARARPNVVAYGSAGIGSTHHLAGELLAKLSKTELLHVPYRGDAASLTALLAGDVPLVVAPPTAVTANLKAGKLRALAVTGPQRWPEMPEVPTVVEQGVPGYDARSWAGFMAPAGVPRAIVDRLNVEINKAITQKEVIQRLKDMGGEAKGSTPEEMKVMVSSELQRWTRLVNETNIPKQ